MGSLDVMNNKMTNEQASDIYMRWRQRTTSVLRDQFDKMFEGTQWLLGNEGWGRVSNCGKFVMVVTEKSIRLVEPNLNK